jgi:hypothetical protein
MKLVLKSFAQEVDVTDLENAVFEDEDSGQAVRLRVPQDTIAELSGIIFGEGQPHIEHVEEIPEEEPVPVATPTPPGRKTLRQRPVQSEDDVPNL